MYICGIIVALITLYLRNQNWGSGEMCLSYLGY